MENDITQTVELLAPAGSYESLSAAIKGGANAVYLGAGKLNMRSHSAKNFSISDLENVRKICFKSGVKLYFTLNSIMYDEDISEMKDICDHLKKIEIDALIAHDQATLNYAKSIDLPTHISTQANISNVDAVKYYSNFADACVLARELNLEQVTHICDQVKAQHICGPSGKLVKIEIFIHGALCVSISGKCYMSLATQNVSANRGKCFQPCRRKYRVIDDETGSELAIDNQYIMSPKDLCTIGFLDKILASGISILKIEGRGRSPEYVYKVTKTYKAAIESIEKGGYTKEKIEMWQKELDSVYNRGFWQGGYYLGKKLGDWSASYGSQATKKKEYIGKISNFFPIAKIAEFKLEAGAVNEGDLALIIGPTTGVLEFKISSIKRHNAGQNKPILTIPVPAKVRRNDQLYLVSDRS